MPLDYIGKSRYNTGMNKQQKGSCGELLAAAALTRGGYEVFLNPTNNGVADLVALKEGKAYRVQVKTFYLKKGSKSGKQYLVAECRTSDASQGAYHVPYARLVDMLVLVDTDTAEVFLVPSDIQKTQVHKNQVLKHRIFP